MYTILSQTVPTVNTLFPHFLTEMMQLRSSSTKPTVSMLTS